jgi:type II secretory pathway pseudopilin PulG
MKQKSRRGPSAFTLIELSMIVLVIALLAVLLLPALPQPRVKTQRIDCSINLKEIGTAYRDWAGDNGDLMPAQQTVKSNGWQDFLTNANQGALCWTNYFLMQNQLGQSPKLLLCPADERTYATSFTNGFDNTHLSYFVGVNANDIYPQSIQGGDRNLGPGTTPDPDYGFSPKSGKGSDVTLPLTSHVSWSLKMHSARNPAGAGNILLGDGSGQQCSSTALNGYWTNAAGTNNWPVGQVPATPSIRLLFP